MNNKKKISEFRQDMVSGDWILVASTRGRRPRTLNHKKRTSWRRAPKKDCPFEDPQKSGNPEPILWYPKEGVRRDNSDLKKDWFVQVVPNKYPAVSPSKTCPTSMGRGPYHVMAGVGFHEVIITRPHSKSLGEMKPEEADTVLRCYQERHIQLKKEKCVEYTLVFHNHGPEAGASIAHPHSQLIALPAVPADVARSLKGSERYFTEYGHCAHCAELEWELKNKKRIIFQNDYFIVLAPFASRISYEVRIYPKWHASHFEEMDEKKRLWLAQALVEALRRLNKTLNDPDYNFFIHTAPAKIKHMEHYHWHFEILPKTAVWAGLELGTGIEVVSTSPEEAAEELRKA